MSTLKKEGFFIILIFFLGLTIGFLKNIWQLMHRDERIKEAEKELKKIETDNLELKQKLEYYQSDEFLEGQIRDKLQMAKPGEAVVILPEELTKEASEEGLSLAEVLEEDKKELANWQKWLSLFW